MRELLNTLYVQTQEAVLRLDSDTVRVVVDHKTRLRAPLLRLNGIVVFGNVTVTPFLIHRYAQDGRSLVWLTRFGRFRGRIQGPTRGNVLLRRAQHRVVDDPQRCADIARQIIAGKLHNSRAVVMRAAREAQRDEDKMALTSVADRLAVILGRLPQLEDLNQLRGAEGEAGRAYFGVFSRMIRSNRSDFAITGRSRRPPRDRLNSVLSFLYALLRGECEAAAESVGLDPQMGCLHSLRPGRPALALDLMEELRSVLADRLALTLVNRRQLQANDFEISGSAVRLTDKGRKIVITSYQKKKEGEVQHRVLGRKLPLGLVPHVQARLLARHLRGDLDMYMPFIWR